MLANSNFFNKSGTASHSFRSMNYLLYSLLELRFYLFHRILKNTMWFIFIPLHFYILEIGMFGIQQDAPNALAKPRHMETWHI